MYSPIILKNILCFFFSKFCKLPRNTTTDLLNYRVWPIRSCVPFKPFYRKKYCENKTKSVLKNGRLIWNQDPGLPTILNKVLSLVLQNFLYLEIFECNTTSNLQILVKKTKNVLENGW